MGVMTSSRLGKDRGRASHPPGKKRRGQNRLVPGFSRSSPAFREAHYNSDSRRRVNQPARLAVEGTGPDSVGGGTPLGRRSSRVIRPTRSMMTGVHRAVGELGENLPASAAGQSCIS